MGASCSRRINDIRYLASGRGTDDFLPPDKPWAANVSGERLEALKARARACMGGDSATVLAVTLDLDDTVWDCHPTIIRADNACYAWLQENAPQVAAECSQDDLKVRMRALRESHPGIRYNFTFFRKQALRDAAKAAGNQNPDAVAEGAFDAFITARNEVGLFKDAVRAISALRDKGLLVGAISNGNATVWRVPALRSLFDFAIRAEDAMAAKPHARPFNIALACVTRLVRRAGREFNNFSADAKCVVHVGDSVPSDVVGAKQAGWRAVLVSRPEIGDHELKEPETKASSAARAGAGGAGGADADVPSLDALVKLKMLDLQPERAKTTKASGSSTSCWKLPVGASSVAQ